MKPTHFSTLAVLISLVLVNIIAFAGCNKAATVNSFDTTEKPEEKQTISFEELQYFTHLEFPEGSKIIDTKYTLYEDNDVDRTYTEDGLYTCIALPSGTEEEFVSNMISSKEFYIYEKGEILADRFLTGRDTFTYFDKKYPARYYYLQISNIDPENEYLGTASYVLVVHEDDENAVVYICTVESFLR